LTGRGGSSCRALRALAHLLCAPGKIGALAERLINFVVFGTYPEWLLPMALDTAHIALLISARRVWQRDAATPVSGGS
jgi:hypothetical protein